MLGIVNRRFQSAKRTIISVFLVFRNGWNKHPRCNTKSVSRRSVSAVTNFLSRILDSACLICSDIRHLPDTTQDTRKSDTPHAVHIKNPSAPELTKRGRAETKISDACSMAPRGVLCHRFHCDTNTYNGSARNLDHGSLSVYCTNRNFTVSRRLAACTMSEDSSDQLSSLFSHISFADKMFDYGYITFRGDENTKVSLVV